MTPSLWSYYDSLPDGKKPAMIRGDIFLGNELFLSQAEGRGAPYLTKLRLTANVKRLIVKLFREAGWIDAGHGFEDAVLVTSLPHEILTIAQLYRDRADCENCFDELKNQWGWGGYTTSDLKPCRLAGRMVALVYNWWSIFVRLARPHKRHEAITSRPLLLHGVASQTKHASQTTLII